MNPHKELLHMTLMQLIREQSEGEWSDEMIEQDAEEFTDRIWPLFMHAMEPKP